MKKNLATAMAAAMAFGAVVPAFAAEVSTFALVSGDSVDARLAAGLEIFVDTTANNKTILTRAEVYNFNGAGADEYSKHTIKDKFKDMTVVYEDKATNKYVLAQKSKNTAGVAAAKAKLENINSEIAVYISNGYVKSEVPTTSTIDEKGNYVAGKKVVTLTKGTDIITITFTNVDQQASQTEIAKETELTNALRKEAFGSDYAWDLSTTNAKTLAHTNTVELSRVKYIVSKNASKFDIVKEETGLNNTNYNVKVYRKGAEKKAHNLVADITVTSFGNIDKEKIITVPTSNDFASHWASNEVLNAMLAGDIDASAKFRPEDGITRAEFAKMLAEILTKVDTTVVDVAYNENKTYAETFHDVVKGDWFQNYVGYLQKAGVVKGDGEKFRPNDKITRQEVAVMLSNALEKVKSDNADANMVDLDGDGVKEAYKSLTTAELNALKFKDKKQIQPWSDHSVKYLSELAYNAKGDKVVKGSNGYFNPAQNITRAESLVMVQRAEQAIQYWN